MAEHDQQSDQEAFVERVREALSNEDFECFQKILVDRGNFGHQVNELLHVHHIAHENWQSAQAQLDRIRRSWLWPLVFVYFAVKDAVYSLPRVLGAVFRLAAHSLGWCYVVGSASIQQAVAWKRRRGGLSSQIALGSGEIGPVVRRPRVLIVMPYHIAPPNHGGGVRLFNLIKRLVERCDLWLLVFSAQGEDREQRAMLEQIGVSVDFHHWQPQEWQDLFGLFPPNVQLFKSQGVAERIGAMVREHEIDVVQLEYTELGQYAEHVPAGTPVILTEHDLAFRSHRRRRALRFPDRFHGTSSFCNTATDVLRIQHHELRYCRRVDRIHVMSRVDGEYLASFLRDGASRIRVVPNGVDCEGLEPPESIGSRAGLLYVGNFQNLPNVDALEFLVRDIWPLLRLRVPDAELTIVGAHSKERAGEFEGVNGITVAGEVSSLAPYYHSHRVLAAPLRAGSGTRLKILEAFAAGLPVVSTTLGAEGIEYEVNKHLVIADTAVQFAGAVAHLLEDREHWRAIADSARGLAKDRYDWSLVARMLLNDYVSLSR